MALGIGVHDTETGIETPATGDEEETTCGGWNEVQKMSVAAAMMGAVVLVPTHTLLLPSDTRRGRTPTDKGWSDAGWVRGDGSGCSTAASPRDLRRFARFRSSALAWSRTSFRRDARLGCGRGAYPFGDGDNYGFLTTAGTGAGFEASKDAAALNAVFGKYGLACLGGRGIRSGNKGGPHSEEVCIWSWSLQRDRLARELTGPESNGHGKLSQQLFERPCASATSLRVRLSLGLSSEAIALDAVL